MQQKIKDLKLVSYKNGSQTARAGWGANILEMKAKVVYIEHEKARRINEILAAEKEFIEFERMNSEQSEIMPVTSNSLRKVKSISQEATVESSL